MTKERKGSPKTFRPTLTLETELMELVNSGKWATWQNLLHDMVEIGVQVTVGAGQQLSPGARALRELNVQLKQRAEIQTVLDQAAKAYEHSQDPTIRGLMIAIHAEYEKLGVELPEAAK